jgi:hypothetical protein
MLERRDYQDSRIAVIKLTAWVLADQNKNKYMFLDQIFQTAHSALSFSNDR